MPATSHSSRQGIFEGQNPSSPCAGAPGAPATSTTFWAIDTWGPVITMVSATVTAGTPPPGVSPFVCANPTSTLYIVGTPATLGVYTYTVDVLMSNGSHNIYNLTHTVETITVTNVAPNNGLSIGGTAVTITGTLFTAGAVVNFDNIAATSVVVVNSTTITCVTPAHAVGLVPVTVTLPSAEFATLDNAYTYNTSGPTGMAPDHGPMAGGTLVTITGNSFEPGMSITFDGIEATSITYVNSTQYTCITPEHAAGDVTVLMTGGSHGTFNAGTYTYDPISGSVWPGGLPSDVSPRRVPEITIDRTKGAASFSNFDLSGDVTPPAAGQRIEVDLTEGPVFEGVAVTVQTSYEEQPSQTRRSITPTDYKWFLDALRPFGAWVDTSASTIVAEIMATYAPEFTLTGLEASLPNISIVLEGALSMSDALTAILTAMNVGGAWYLDVKDLHFFEAESSGLNPETITDDLETFLKDPPITIVEDVRQIRNRVYGKGWGSNTAAAAVPGSTTLEVTSLLPFSKTGGYAIVNGRVIHYTGVATISQAVFRRNAPSGGGFESFALLTGGNVVEGNIRDIPYYKVSAVDAAGVESDLSAPSSYIGASPQVSVGSGSAIGSSTEVGYMPPGEGHVYRFAMRTSAGTIAPAVGSGFGASAGPFGAVELTSGIPWASDPRVVAVDVYRTKTGTNSTDPATPWFLVATMTPLLTTWIDKLNDDSLSGANPDLSYPYINSTGIISELIGIPLGGPGTVSRKLYRSTYRNPDVWRFLATIPDNTTTTYEDNAQTPRPNLYDELSVIDDDGGSDDTPGGLPPIIHLVLTGIPSSGDFSIDKAIPAGVAVNIWTQVDDVPAQRELADRLGGTGVRAYTVVDTSLDAANLTSRVQAELTLWADPIKTITWATLDPLALEGRTQEFSLIHPPLTGSFVIQSVKEDQLHVTSGREPRRICTASSVRFTLDDLFHKVLEVANGGGAGGGGGSVPAQNVGGGSSIDTTDVQDGDLLIGRLSDRTVKLAQLTAGTGIVVTPGAGSLAIAIAAPEVGQTPTGTVNGVNTVFTTATAYRTGTLRVYVNGIRQKTSYFSETTSTTFTFTTAPSTGDEVLVDYET